MDVNYIVLLLVAIIMALSYGIVGFFAKKLTEGESYSVPKLIATIIYSIVVGFLAVNTGIFTLGSVSVEAMAPVFAEYLGFLYIIQTVLDAIFVKLGWSGGLSQAFVRK
jgi:uncharacterized SAM-binding protein YcdF (DUF218 family)